MIHHACHHVDLSHLHCLSRKWATILTYSRVDLERRACHRDLIPKTSKFDWDIARTTICRTSDVTGRCTRHLQPRAHLQPWVFSTTVQRQKRGWRTSTRLSPQRGHLVRKVTLCHRRCKFDGRLPVAKRSDRQRTNSETTQSLRLHLYRSACSMSE